MRRAPRLALERLEDRDTPTTAGMPWIDPLHLTLSLAPDGTLAGTTPNSLAQTLSGQIPTGDWRAELLRAFQTWAVNANINLGLVADGGQALGSLGLVQGDSRFGDIRLAATPLGLDTVATGTPFQPNGSTWAGDMVLNTRYSFGLGGQSAYDLFSVALHEAGHVFGLGDSSNVASVMYGNYTGVRAGLDAQDVADLRGLYGPRQPDAFDARQANGSQQSATPLGGFSAPVSGDISALDDVDWYKFTVPDSAASGAGLYLQLRTSGLSLLVGSLTVYDGSGNVVAASAASGPLGGDLVVSLSGLSGGTYYARVGNATQSVFGIGSYQLSLSTQRSTSNRSTQAFVNADNRQNDTIKTAITLTGRNSGGTRLDFAYPASIGDAADVDFYQVHSQAAPAGATLEMIALVSAADVNGLAPRVDVYDSSGNPVLAQVIGNERGFFSVQVPGALPDRDYYVKVSSLAPTSSHGTGNYFLGVNFSTTPTVNLKSFASGVLTAANRQEGQALSVSKATALHFILSADAATAAQVQMSIYDAAGNLVFRLVGYAGQAASTGVAYLNAGSYTVRYAAVTRDGSLASSVAFTLKGNALTDPIGPVLTDSSGSTVTTTTTTTDTTTDTTWDDLSYLSLATSDGWIDAYFYF